MRHLVGCVYAAWALVACGTETGASADGVPVATAMMTSQGGALAMGGAASVAGSAAQSTAGTSAVPGAECATASPWAGRSLVLTDAQLATTIQSLFPFGITLPELPVRPRGKHAFSTASLTNEFTFNQVNAMTAAAEEIAAQAHDNLSQLLPCDLIEGRSCVSAFIDTWGARAFRRPVEAAEATALLSLYDGVSATETPELAVSAVIAAILQSPQFVYQLDLGDLGDPADAAQQYALTDHELASHLSYLLVDAPPDDTLRSLAEQGGLSDAATLQAQVQRLLADPRGQAMGRRFAAEWFDVAGEDLSTRVDASLAAAFQEEADRDLQAWLFGDGAGSPLGLRGLLSSTSSYVNQSLATHYGLGDVSMSDTDWQLVELPEHYQGGLLTKGLVATRFSNLEEPSVILRGVFVVTELLCINLGTPPNNAVDQNPDLGPDALPREKVAARGALPVCGACHSVIDPVGLGMEELDQQGRFRAAYASGAPVDNAGRLGVLDPPEFAGTTELAQRIAADDRFLSCAAQQWTEYAFGGKVPADSCASNLVANALLNGKGSVEDMVVSLVQSRTFLERDRGAAGGGQ